MCRRDACTTRKSAFPGSLHSQTRPARLLFRFRLERRVGLTVEAIAHALDVVVPVPIVLLDFAFDLPHLGECLVAGDGHAESLAQEELGPLPQREERAHALEEVVIL